MDDADDNSPDVDKSFSSMPNLTNERGIHNAAKRSDILQGKDATYDREMSGASLLN